MKEQILKQFDDLMSHLNSEENSMAEEFRNELKKVFKTKDLYVLVSNGGDGSYYPHYTMDASFIQKMNERDEAGLLDCEDLGCDGDGFHYDTIKVPAFYTLEMMGESDCAYDIEDELEDEEDE